jgi:predicted alpha/beta superfamily hydrolase
MRRLAVGGTVPRVTRKSAITDLGVFRANGLVDRYARLYVPAREARRDDRPLIVMLDGQNVFGDEGSFAGGWHTDEMVDKLVSAPAVLAIDHGGDQRIAELGAPKSTKLVALASLIVDEMLPAARERVPFGARYVVGSSMGGLAALYMALRWPDVFAGAVCMSPSLWFDRRGIFGWVDQQPSPPASRIYLDAGAKEAGGRLAGVVEAMGLRLRDRNLHVMVRIDPLGTHHESSWRKRLPRALRFVLAG